MNERIKKLYEQSFVTDDYVNVGINGVELGIKFDPEKFAELIIEECVEVAHPKLTDVGEWAAGMRLVQQRLKQHFGVKE